MPRSFRSLRECARSLWSRTEEHRVPPPTCQLAAALMQAQEQSAIPAFECFASKISESDASAKFDNDARVGDVIAVKVKRCDIVGAYVKPICFVQRLKRDLEWLDMQLLAPVSALSRRLTVGEYLHARVVALKPVKIELVEAAPLTYSQLPEYFRIGCDLPKRQTIAEEIEERTELRNPYLETTLGFPTRSRYSFLALKGLESDRCESASMMRRHQDSQLAMTSVVKGVEEMKSGNRDAALAHLNRALSVDVNCVDALVARGAVFSNEGNYRMAEMNFEDALRIDSVHVNAQKYFVETLIKWAQLSEVEGNVELARSKYLRCLEIKDDKRARLAMEKLNKRRSPSLEIVDSKRSVEKRRRDSSEKKDEQSAEKKKRRESTGKEEREKRQREKKKLQEMEAFIKALKNGK